MLVIITAICLLLILSIVASVSFYKTRNTAFEIPMQKDESLQQIVSLSIENEKYNSSVHSDAISGLPYSKSVANDNKTSSLSNENLTKISSSHSSTSSDSETSTSDSSSSSESSSDSSNSSDVSIDTGDVTEKHVSYSCTVDFVSESNGDQNEKTEQTKSKRSIFKKGQVINGRYKIEECLGEGTFGLVVSAIDNSNDNKVAIKVINSQKHKRMAKEEIEVLQKLLEIDPQGAHLFVRMEEYFVVNVYSCIVFEILGLSVYEYQKKRQYEPYSLDDIRHIAYQILYAIDFLHSNCITHTDLKPENVVFVDYPEPLSTYVKIIDFGSATFEEEGFIGVVTTRHYRAPEVLLQLGWSYPCDVWSIGCIICEMYNGDVLFPKTHENGAHLWMMQRIIGPIPAEMRLETRKRKYFDDGLEKLKSSQKEKIMKKSNPLRSYMRSEKDRDLFDLISQMFTYEPRYRITCKMALQHAFFYQLPPKFRLT